MATFAFYMVAALSEEWLGQGEVTLAQLSEALSLNTLETLGPSRDCTLGGAIELF